MSKSVALLMACGALSLPVAACGGDDGDGGGDGAGDGGAPATEQTETRTQATEGVTVDMKDIKFIPQDITVDAGTTVTWTNSDGVPHTVTKTGGPGEDFDSGNIEPGGTYEYTFEQKGKIDYVCTIHPGQDGTVTVE